jgi:cobaltochelatase CobT
LAALLRAELFREGIDGEAVLWAAGRLGKRSEARRILLVVSDGSPMDGATHLANDAHYLDNHLQQVAQRIERGRSGIELCALGVGLDLSPFYARCQAVDVAEPPAQVLRDMLQLLARPSRR